MALSAGLAKAGNPPDELTTSATVTFQPGEGITKIALTVEGACPASTTRLRARPRGREGELPRLEGARRRARDHAGGPATLIAGMAADFDSLIDELERYYSEAQEQMSDPSVYNDHREAAEVGRRLKELEGPYKLAQEWRRARRPRGRARRRRPEGARPRARGADSAARGGAAARAGRRAIPPTEGRHPRGAPGRRRRRGGALGRRPLPDARALRGAARLQGRGARARARATAAATRRSLRGQGRRRVLGLQVGGRHAPRAARPRDGVPGPHPHVDRDRRRDARGRGGRGRHRPERPEDRRLPLDRPRRPVA